MGRIGTTYCGAQSSPVNAPSWLDRTGWPAAEDALNGAVGMTVNRAGMA